jgi:hypothetical protein
MGLEFLGEVCGVAAEEEVGEAGEGGTDHGWTSVKKIENRK